MLTELGKEKAKLDEVKRFFVNGTPIGAQVDAARDAYMEAERLKAEALSEVGNEEYVELGEFFKRGTGFVEISDMERTAERADEISRQITAMNDGVDSESREMRKLFPDKVPTEEDMARMEGASKSSPKLLKALMILLGIGVAFAGALIGKTVGLAMGIAGLAISLFPVIFLGKSKKSKEILALARGYNGCECSNLKGIVEELKKKLAAYNTLSSEREAKRERLVEELAASTLKVCEFLEKFPLVDADTILESVQIIKHKYTQFYAVSKAGEASASGKIEKLKRSEALMTSAREFLDKFPTASNNPFAEIRDRLSDLAYLTASVARLERECDVFAVKYGVTGKAVATDAVSEAAVNATLSETALKLRAIADEQTLINREINILRSEIEKKDEYAMAKEELEELYKKHVESLEVIKKTSAFLKEACDNITSKYLGKTKEKFKEYSSLITGTEGEYTLNTSFELTKTERGEAHTIESYSRGTRDLYALSLRLALVDALYEKESPFIILDDPFTALDDAKLERAKATLKTLGKTKQILYFTCTKARAIE